MTTQRLTDFSLIETLYQTRLQKDFSPDELKPLEFMKNSWLKNAYECYGLFDGSEIAGYAFFVRRERDYLLDYLAIAQERRNEGLGSVFLGQLAECMQGAECFICEVENPEAAEREEDRQLRERRLQFYLRNGFREAEFTSVLFGVNYRILELPAGHVHTREELRTAYTELYRSSVPETVFNTRLQVN